MNIDGIFRLLFNVFHAFYIKQAVVTFKSKTFQICFINALLIALGLYDQLEYHLSKLVGTRSRKCVAQIVISCNVKGICNANFIPKSHYMQSGRKLVLTNLCVTLIVICDFLQQFNALVMPSFLHTLTPGLVEKEI